METEQETNVVSIKKPRAKRRPKPAAAAAKPDGIYAGLTVANCATACTANRCVISGIGICAHPSKGGLQASMQSNEAVRRYNEAKRVIGKRKFEVPE